MSTDHGTGRIGIQGRFRGIFTLPAGLDGKARWTLRRESATPVGAAGPARREGCCYAGGTTDARSTSGWKKTTPYAGERLTDEYVGEFTSWLANGAIVETHREIYHHD